MDSETVTTAVADLRAVVKNFLEELADRGISADRLGEIIEGTAEFDSTDLSQFQERFVEDHLIWPVLECGVQSHCVPPAPGSNATVGDSGSPHVLT